jgi:hypothetical protein
LISSTPSVYIVISNSCNQTMTFEIEGQRVSYLGDGDLHDPKYSFLVEENFFAGFGSSDFSRENSGSGNCVYYMSVYPTRQFEESQRSNKPLFMAVAILCVSLFIVLAFIAFDCLVSHRQNRLMKTATKQHALVSSLFPKSIQKQLMEEVEDGMKTGKKFSSYGKAGLRSYLDGESRDNEATNSKPIADLFPETTVMFADIAGMCKQYAMFNVLFAGQWILTVFSPNCLLAGFTAWASTREPSQVFTLLETIYREFDRIAKRRRVFKVEVVGDCYVAVCGLPDPRPNHALIMAKFSRDCLTTMKTKTKELEVELGPDTTELGLRVGLHSGPVVAGVLRGEKSRFQLFGDTVRVLHMFGF